MSRASSAISNVAPPAPASVAVRPEVVVWRDMVELTKPGIVRMVVVSGAVGFAMAAMFRPGLSAVALSFAGVACLIGIALSAAGANVLNQVMEVRPDGLMKRTRNRPLPDGRVAVMRGGLFGGLLCLLGLGLLGIVNGPIPAAVSAATMLTYLLWYTPLKPVTPLATIVGSLPGALPPLIGWTAAGGSLGDAGGWSIFAIMFVWQVPHFLAIAWKYRDEYAKAGYLVLPVVEGGEGATARAAVLWAAALIPISLVPVVALGGVLGVGYAAIATILGAGFLWAAVRLARGRTDRDALTLFIASIVYLPILLVAMVVDGLVGMVV